MIQSRSVRTLVALVLASLLPASALASDWPSFRGPGARGVADGEDPPVEWNVESGKNVRWRVPVPGLGHSSPVVQDGRIFLTTAVTEGSAAVVYGDDGGIDLADDAVKHTWVVLALDAADGSVVWRREAAAGAPRAKRHVKSSQANSTPATDGHVVVAILGSEGLFAFERDGEPRWRVDLGVLDPGLFGEPSSHWGYASSPIVVDGRVVVQVDRHEGSFLAAYDAATGKEVWKVARDERPVWATPVAHRGADRNELIVMGGYYVRGYRFADGEELWRFGDEAEVKTTSPFVAGERVILSGGYRARPIFAVRLGGEGDLSLAEGAEQNEHLLWRTERGGPYTSTPIVYGEHVYGVSDKGVLSVYDLKTGERRHRLRTEEHFSAALVASDGRLYLAGEGGTVLVVRAGTELEILGQNDMGEALMATPAIAGGTLYVRGRSTLFALAKSEG